MHKRWLISLCMIIFLVGCAELTKDLSKVPAFQDEFTREFMASKKEVSEGYYLFESKTVGYTVPFPGDARIDEIHYEKVGNVFESIKFGSESEKHTGESYTVYMMYENPTRPDSLEVQLSSVVNALNYDGDFEEKEYENITHYFARQKYVLSSGDSSVYYFFGVVSSNPTNQYISYRYAVRCPDERTGCNYDLDTIEQAIEKMMTSLKFKEK